MARNQPSVFWSTVVGILVIAPATTVWGGLWLIDLQSKFLERQAKHLIEPVESREQTVLETIHRLDRMRAAPCSDEELNELRQIVIRSTMIMDILRREGTALQCSAVFGRQSLSIPGLERPGEVVSREQTVWRNEELPWIPGHRFLLIAHNNFVLVAAAASTLKSPKSQGVSVSRMFVNAKTQQVQWLYGPHLDVPDSAVRDGVSVWRDGYFNTFACTTSGDICVGVGTSFAYLLWENAQWIFLMGLTATAFGGSLGSLNAVCRRQRQTIPFRLQKALRAGVMRMHYQPIVDGASGAIVGAEALMRWPGSNLEPDVFIPAAEEAGLTGEITDHSIRRVSQDLGCLLRSHPGFRVTINITAEDLEDERLHRALADHIEGTGIAPEQVALELTERLAARMEQAKVAINRLRERGYRFYIDDFGTGYSSFSYLSDLSVDAIKLDRSFTASIGSGSVRARLVRPILEMAREAGIPVIIEGVERGEEMELFQQYGVFAMQGWYFSRALTVEELLRLMEDVSVEQENAAD